MTAKARIVLQDCKLAIKRHTLNLQGEELRASWVAILALLRAIGHVLSKVDSKQSPEMNQSIDEWWKALINTKPEPAIFWGFIESGRNNLIKMYEHGISRHLIVPGPEFEGKPSTIWIDQANSRGGGIRSEQGYAVSNLATGPFAGRYEKEVASEACNWWLEILNIIDERAKEIENSQGA